MNSFKAGLKLIEAQKFYITARRLTTWLTQASPLLLTIWKKLCVYSIQVRYNMFKTLDVSEMWDHSDLQFVIVFSPSKAITSRR